MFGKKQPVENGNLASAAGDPHPNAAQHVKVDGFVLNTCWAITGGKKLTQTERNELGEQQRGSVSSAFFFLIKNDAVLVWQLSLEHCINSQTWINGFESYTVKKKI